MNKKRMYEVVNNNPHQTSLKLGKEELKFNRDNFMYVDEEKGKELQRLYDGEEAIINETEVVTGSEPGHRYFFGVGSRTYQENYERIFRRKANGTTQTRKRRTLQTTGQETEG